MSAREYNEGLDKQRRALAALRRAPVTKKRWEEFFPGARLAPTIEQLRNAHGFTILGDGSIEKPYRLEDRCQTPQRVAVTDAMKEAYYLNDHWIQIRQDRLRYDGYSCLLCRSDEFLQIHHIKYVLFAEKHWHLMTVCRECHEQIHEFARLKFPSGMSAEHAIRLGFKPKWEPWLLPEIRTELFT